MKWSNFRNSCLPTISSKTVITVDPRTPDAECLRVYACAAPIQPAAIVDHLVSNIVDGEPFFKQVHEISKLIQMKFIYLLFWLTASSIQNVLSANSILSRAWADMNNTISDDEQQFTALIYAVVTHLDLHHENSVITKWLVKLSFF